MGELLWELGKGLHVQHLCLLLPLLFLLFGFAPNNTNRLDESVVRCYTSISLLVRHVHADRCCVEWLSDARCRAIACG